MSISLYRKYRPQRFQDVVGQEPIEKTLCNAISEGNVSHAYLFCGPRGTGKTTTARLLAKALLCEKGPTTDPCGICESCTYVANGQHPDVYELDAASRTGVENVREEIIGRVAFSPTHGAYKVYIIDEVHMLSIAAFNALLKTLEEPPAHVVFILCTTDPQKVPETILSRCQRFDFRRISVPDIMKNLRYICDKEGFAYDDASLELIAKHASGGMRDAITSLEQLAVFSKGTITYGDAEGMFGEVGDDQLFDLADLIATRDIAGCFRWISKFSESGTDYTQLTHDLTAHMRDIYVTVLSDGAAEIEGANVDELKRYQEQGKAFGGPDRLARILSLLGELNFSLKQATDARLAVEVALTRMARPDADITLGSLAERIEALENGAVATMPPAVSQPVQHSAAPTPSEQPAQRPVVPKEPAQQHTAADEVPVAQKVAGGESAQPTADEEPPAQAVADEKSAAQAAVPEVTPQDGSPAVLDDASVQRLWAEVMKEIKAHKRSLAGVFAPVVVKPDVSGGILVEFPRGNDFSKSIAEEPESREFVKEALKKVSGKKVAFKLVSAKATSGDSKATKKPAAPRKPVQPKAPVEPEGFESNAADEDDMPPVSGLDLTKSAQAQSEPAQAEPEPKQTRQQAKTEPVQEQPPEPRPAEEKPSSEDSASRQPDTEAADDDEKQLEQMLQNGFGAGIQVEELKEDHVEEEQ